MATRKRKDTDDDTTERSAAEEIEAELAAGKRTGVHTEESRDGGDVEVDLDEDDDDDDEPSVAADPAASRRAEKRRDRYRENKERAERLERELEQERERGRQATLRADALALSFRNGGTQQQPGKDPLDAQIEAAETEKQQFWDDYTKLPGDVQLEAERYKAFMQKSREYDRKIYSLVARKEMQSSLPAPGPSPGRMLADTQFPDVMAHPQGSQRTDALLRYKLECGEPNTPQTLIAALTEVRRQLGTGGKQRDTSSLKAKLGHSSSSRGAGGETQRRTVTLTPAMRKLAKATYKGVDEATAFKKFAREYMQDDD